MQMLTGRAQIKTFSHHHNHHLSLFMGKSIIPSLSSTQKLQQFASRVINSSNRTSSSSNKPRRPAQLRPISKAQPGPDPYQPSLSHRPMEAEQQQGRRRRRMPLGEVVSDCVRRWFQDTLKEAKSGDISMQVLVGQMYCSGYGVARDEEKGRAWISRASRTRSAASKVGDKHPGYNASDSDSDGVKEDSK